MSARPFTVAEVREAYLSFFAAKGCVRFPSASLVPENDPTTLFTVAGMSQFKDMFLGRGTHPFTRATTAQKCIRTNDIMNVGRTARHHTFFEMLGNFSFNDYFKKETIHWAWEFLTKALQLDADRLSISVHRIDGEAHRIWREEIGIPENRIFKLGDADNFWPANAPSEGPEGPGGCCSEIFWDHRINTDPNDNLTSSTGRFVEIWNLVFPQYNVRKPHADGSPNLEDLGRANIDTGSGLERVAAVMQGVYNNYDIDLFQTIIRRVCDISGQTYDTTAPLGQKSVAAENNALIRRIADHVRAVTFCVADGALPGNSDRGYIVRRLVRRATLDLEKLGVQDAQLFQVVPAVIDSMGRDYPELLRRQDLAKETLKAEEQLFRRTLHKGLELFQRSLDKQKGSAVFSGDDAFELVTTHGFPKEVIAELASAEGLAIDDAQFKTRWEGHQKVSNTKSVDVFTSTALQEAKPRLGVTPFVGYGNLEHTTAITLLEVDGKESASAARGSKVRFSLAETPFYAESGGQVGDLGQVFGVDPATREAFAIKVTDVQKDEGLVIHHGEVLMGTAQPGPIKAKVDVATRTATTRHHSATHLLHSALTRVLGDHVEQQGSKVSPTELRFDFNHPGAPTREQLVEVEQWVRERISAQLAVDIRIMGIDQAKQLGAKAQFGEKYGAEVRVVTMGDGTISREFCGGCHVANTHDIAAFRITSEGASSAGIRRIVAVAGERAVALEKEEAAVAKQVARAVGLDEVDDPRAVEELARLFKAQPREVPARVQKLVDDANNLALQVGTTRIAPGGTGLLQRVMQVQDELKRLGKIAEQKAAQAAAGLSDGLIAAAVTVNGVKVVATAPAGLDGKALRTLAETIQQKLNGVVVLASASADGKVGLVAAVAKDIVARGISAGTLVGGLAPYIGGKGGGKPDFAQAGGSDAAGIPAAIDAVRALVESALASGPTSR